MTLDTLLNIVGRCVDNQVAPESLLTEDAIGLDSVAVIEMIMGIEAESGFMISPEDFSKCKTVMDLYTVIQGYAEVPL